MANKWEAVPSGRDGWKVRRYIGPSASFPEEGYKTGAGMTKAEAEAAAVALNANPAAEKELEKAGVKFASYSDD